MKNKLLSLLLTVALIFTVFGIVACQPQDQETWPINIANFWSGNEDEETYTVRAGEDGTSVVISYEKSGEWQWVRRSLATEEAEQLANVKTLVLEGKMTTSTNDPRITLKIEYSGDIAAKEVHFYMSETVATYEWDLTGAQLDKAVRLLIFAEGSRVSAEGSIEISRFQLTNEEINEANDVTKQTPPVAETKVNQITAESKTANAGWYDNGDGVYTIAQDGTAYNVSYEKKSFGWALFYALVKGDALAQMKTFSITVQGTAGQVLIVKPFDKVEARYTLTGEEDLIQVDLTTAQDVDYTAELKIIIFAQPDTQDVSGSFQILGAEFSTEDATVTPDPTPSQTVSPIDSIASSLVNDGTSSRFTIAGNKLTYTTAGWDTAVGYINVDGVSSIAVTVKGISGHTAILKIGSIEQKFEASSANGVLSGEEQTVMFDVSALNGVQEFRVFADWDAWADIETVTGELTIVSVRNVATIESIASSLVNANAAGRFTIAGNKLTYTTAGWDTAVGYINVDGVSTIAVTVKGISGHTAILKIGGIEQKFEASSANGVLSGEEQTVTFDVAALSGLQEFRVFADWDAWADISTVTGELTIVSVRNVATIENVASSLVNANAAGRFTIDGSKLTYTTAGWDTAVCYVNLDGINTITVKVKGINGHTAILKIGGVEQKFEASSANGVLNGEEQTVTFDVSALSGIQEFRVFADWDAWADIETVTGELTIVSVVAA